MKKPKFNFNNAVDYFTLMHRVAGQKAAEIFRIDNDGRSPEDYLYDANYFKCRGEEAALEKVLEYLSKFEM